MDQRRLEAYVRLVESGAFRQTAIELNVTQPALSQMIARLEKDIGLKLIDRSTRPVTTTEAGREFYFRSRKVLDAMQSIESLVQDAHEARFGRVRIGIVPAMMFSEPAKSVRSFIQQNPQAEVQVRSLATALLLEELAQGSVDVAILLTKPDLKGVSNVELYREDYMVCLPEGHHLTELDEVKFAMLEDENLIRGWRGANAEGYDAIIAACAGAGFSPKGISVHGSYLDHAGMVSAGMGVSFAPVSFQHMRPNNVTYRTLTDPTVGMAVSISWFEDHLDSVGKKFVEHCIAECAGGDASE